jgi:uncharacterized membrane protein
MASSSLETAPSSADLAADVMERVKNSVPPNDESPVNVGHAERAYSLAAAAGLGIIGLKVRGLTGLGLLGAAYLLAKRGYTGHCGLYERLGHSTAQPPEPQEYFERGIHVEAELTIHRPRAELFAFWRNLENLPRFMNHLQSVKTLEDKRSHWVAKAPAGLKVEWNAEIINEEPDELIAWRSLGGADVDNAGSIRFVDAGEGATQVKVVMDYIPPAGVVGKWIAVLFGEAPEATVQEDLRRFKQIMEQKA